MDSCDIARLLGLGLRPKADATVQTSVEGFPVQENVGSFFVLELCVFCCLLTHFVIIIFIYRVFDVHNSSFVDRPNPGTPHWVVPAD